MADPTGGGEGRRRFFREGLARALAPLGRYLDRRLNLPTPRTRLRPPGALPEDDFLDTCYRCGTCLAVCPADAIRQWAPGDERTARTPFIDADLAACTLCPGLVCTQECPSGALRRLSGPHEVAMGLAGIDRNVCLRSRDEECSLCVDHCPMRGAALVAPDRGPPKIIQVGCIGCGVCQLHCPTSPKAIVIRPH